MTDLPVVTLQRLVQALDALHVPYAIIGGVAVSIRSVPRYTSDIDAVLWYGEDHWDGLIKGLGQYGFTPRSADPIAFARANRMLLLSDADSVPVDLSFGALPFEEDLVKGAEKIEIGEGIATVEALVIMKAIAWRPKDQLDLRELIGVNPGIDRDTVIRTFSAYAELLDVPERVTLLESIFDEAPQ